MSPKKSTTPRIKKDLLSVGFPEVNMLKTAAKNIVSGISHSVTFTFRLMIS
jgi:hypothetical protein